MVYWLGVVITLFMAWVVFRIIIRQDYSKRGGLSFFSTILEFLIFGTHANLPYLYLEVPWPQLPPLPESSLQLVLGLVFVVSGLLATVLIMAYLGFSISVGDRPEQLRQSGPYQWSRNPQLLSYGYLLLGCVILYPSWQAAAWLILYGFIAQLMVLTEEEHLERVFGETYQNYCRHVPRYIRIFSGTGILRR